MVPFTVAQVLQNSVPGQLHQPIRVDEWSVLLRLEQFFPAQLDAIMRQRLLNELFEQWIQEEIIRMD